MNSLKFMLKNSVELFLTKSSLGENEEAVGFDDEGKLLGLSYFGVIPFLTLYFYRSSLSEDWILALYKNRPIKIKGGTVENTLRQERVFKGNREECIDKAIKLLEKGW